MLDEMFHRNSNRGKFLYAYKIIKKIKHLRFCIEKYQICQILMCFNGTFHQA